MVTRYSFRLATALLGLLVIIFPFLGFPATFENILLVIFGSLIILFSLADNRQGQGEQQIDSR